MRIPVSLDTADGSGWTVTRVLVGGESNTTAANNVAAVEVANNPGWADLGDPNAKWVSWDSSTGTGYTGDVNGTEYIYTKSFTIGGAGSNKLLLGGSFLTDNYATSVTLTIGSDVLPVSLDGAVVPPTPTEFGYRNLVDVSAVEDLTSPEVVTLTITTVNSYADPANLDAGTNPGPTGFEVSGVASTDVGRSGAPATPLPEAAMSGMSLLSGIGGLSVLRKRLLRV